MAVEVYSILNIAIGVFMATVAYTACVNAVSCVLKTCWKKPAKIWPTSVETTV